MLITELPQFKRNAKRFEQIVRILAKYGLAKFIEVTDSGFVKKVLAKVGNEEVPELARASEAERIRMALTELGTTFIKLGQMLSTRADLVGEEIALELEQLQSKTPADSAETVRDLFEAEIGSSPEEVFLEFDEEALASASIAQVHRASLKDGTPVVVKVQHAGIEDKVINDLDILIALADLAERSSSELRLYQPKSTVVEFRRNLLRELDFALELQNLRQFQQNFEEDKTVRIPTPYPEFSARQILTMDRLDGFSLQDTDRIREEGLDPKLLARRGVNVFIEMIFRDRFYHADPHPGNLLVLEDNVIGLLDCGMVGLLDNTTRENFEGLIEGFMTKDVELLTDYSLRLGSTPADLDRERLEADIDRFITEHLSGSMKDFDLGLVLGEFTEIVRSHRIVQKPSIQLLCKVLVMLEGTGRLLDPDFNLNEVLEPVYQKAAREKLSPENLASRFTRAARDWDRLMQGLPRDLSDIIRRVRQGTLDVHLEHRKLDAVVNRMTYGIITAALFLGSTLLWSQNIPPRMAGASLPGILGVGLSLWLGRNLILAIMKSGGLTPGDD